MYPDGCTQFHIDYAAGGYEEKEDEMSCDFYCEHGNPVNFNEATDKYEYDTCCPHEGGTVLTLTEAIKWLNSTDDYAWPLVKAELARLQAALDTVVAEYHAAINEPVYAGTRLDWMQRCQAAEQRVREQDCIIHSLIDTQIVLEGLDEPHIQG